jgi:hypothetical protein
MSCDLLEKSIDEIQAECRGLLWQVLRRGWNAHSPSAPVLRALSGKQRGGFDARRVGKNFGRTIRSLVFRFAQRPIVELEDLGDEAIYGGKMR